MAFAELYDAIAPRGYGLIRRVLRDPAQSEEVFLELWRHTRRFDSTKGSGLSWAMTIAHRRAVDRVRSVQAVRDREDAYGTLDQDVAHDSTAEAVALASGSAGNSHASSSQSWLSHAPQTTR